MPMLHDGLCTHTAFLLPTDLEHPGAAVLQQSTAAGGLDVQSDSLSQPHIS